MKLRFTQLNYVRMICCLRFIRDPSTHRPISRKQFYPSQNWSGKLLDFTFVFCSNKSVGRLQHSHFTNSSAGHLSRSKPVLSLQGDCRRRLCSETKLGLNRRYLYYITHISYNYISKKNFVQLLYLLLLGCGTCFTWCVCFTWFSLREPLSDWNRSGHSTATDHNRSFCPTCPLHKITWHSCCGLCKGYHQNFHG